MSGVASAALGTTTTGPSGGAGNQAGTTSAPSAPQLSAVSTPATHGNGASGSVSDWTTGLNDDLRGYVQNKGFKDPGAVVDSYRNIEKLMGVPQERLLKLPAKEDDPGWSEVYDRLGRPKDPKEYKIEVPKGDDGKFAEWARGTFHELGISKNAGEKLVGKWNEYAQNAQKTHFETYSAQAEKEEGALKKEWGLAFEKHVSIAKQAVNSFGLDGESIEKLEGALGYGKLMKLLHNIGSKLGEGQFHSSGSTGSGFNGALTPDAARNKIQTLRGDADFVRRYANGEMSAKEEMERLHRMAYPESS
jgi:hypothetical protein